MATKYNTGNEIGSADPRDLNDNAVNIDEWATSTTKLTHPDRLGVSRKTWHGMEEDFDTVQNERETEYLADKDARDTEFAEDQTQREAEFTAAQQDKADRFNSFLASSGYESLGDYAAGIEVTEYNQGVVDSNGDFWRIAFGSTLPYTTTGAGLPEGDNFVFIGEGTLRQELATGVANVFSSTGTQTVAEALDIRLPVVNIRAFGCSPAATPAENSAGIATALSVAEGTYQIYVPAGTYLFNETIEIPSNTSLFGDGFQSVLRMDASVRRGESLVVTGHRGVHKTNIKIYDLTLDFNRERWDTPDSTSVYVEMFPAGTPRGESNIDIGRTTLDIRNTSSSKFSRLRVIDGYSHCIDVGAPWYGRGTGSQLDYDEEPSAFITLEDCIASGAGDDNITTHQCSHIWINRCYSHDSSGRVVKGNSNGIEIDDGSRNIWVTDCTTRRTDNGLQIKGHNDAPAPYNVYVDNYQSINDRYGIEIRHTGYYGEGTVDDDPLPDDPQVLSGVSLTARNVFITNAHIVAPREKTYWDNTVLDAERGLRVRSYENVNITNLTISDGSDQKAAALDDYALGTSVVYPVQVNGFARDVKFVNLTILGFKDIVRGAGDCAIRIYSSIGSSLVFNGLSIKRGPSCGFYAAGGTGDGKGHALSYVRIVGDHLSNPDSIGMRLSSENAGNIHDVLVTGYTTEMFWPQLGQSSKAIESIKGPLQLQGAITNYGVGEYGAYYNNYFVDSQAIEEGEILSLCKLTPSTIFMGQIRISRPASTSTTRSQSVISVEVGVGTDGSFSIQWMRRSKYSSDTVEPVTYTFEGEEYLGLRNNSALTGSQLRFGLVIFDGVSTQQPEENFKRVTVSEASGVVPVTDDLEDDLVVNGHRVFSTANVEVDGDGFLKLKT